MKNAKTTECLQIANVVSGVGVEVQNSYVLGLGLMRVQIDKY